MIIHCFNEKNISLLFLSKYVELHYLDGIITLFHIHHKSFFKFKMPRDLFNIWIKKVTEGVPFEKLVELCNGNIEFVEELMRRGYFE